MRTVQTHRPGRKIKKTKTKRKNLSRLSAPILPDVTRVSLSAQARVRLDNLPPPSHRVNGNSRCHLHCRFLRGPKRLVSLSVLSPKVEPAAAAPTLARSARRNLFTEDKSGEGFISSGLREETQHKYIVFIAGYSFL